MKIDDLAFPTPLAIPIGHASTAIPLRPALHLRSLSLQRKRNTNLHGKRSSVITVSGRTALSIFAQMRGISSTSRILLPSYHCPSMVAPFVMCGSKIEFYAITKTLEPDRDSLTRLLLERTDAVVLPNYFGVKRPPAECIEDVRAAGADVSTIWLTRISTCAGYRPLIMAWRVFRSFCPWMKEEFWCSRKGRMWMHEILARRQI